MLIWLRKLTHKILRASTTSKPASWFVDWLHQERDEETGVPIDGKSCLRYAPVWNAVNRIAGRVAQLPLIVYEQTSERTKMRAVKHPAYVILKRRPNAVMTPATFKELLTYHAIIWGNGRAAIVRDRRANPIELVPLLPGQSKTVLVNGAKWHTTEVTLDSGEIVAYKFRDEDVLHVMGLGYDGIQGYALYDLARGSWGLGLALEKNSSRLFRNQTIPGLILEAPAGVFADDEEAKKFLAAFRGMHEGLDNVGKTALLREGIKASKLSQSGQEAQAIEQRSFQREEAGLWFLLESMLGIESSVSYNSLEQKQLAELINCLNPWLVKWQEQCEAKLLREREIEADSHFVRFNTGALLRSDTRTTYQTLAEGVRGRLITPNEARAVLDMDPIEGGDTLQNPAIDVNRPPASGGREPAGDEKNDRTDQSDGSRARLQAAITARVLDMAGVERQRIQTAAAKPAGVASWADGFYPRWQETFAAALEPLVPPGTSAATLAAEWVEESRADLGREGNLTEILAGWDERARRLAEALV
jgi:HK97 family phage portal protein